jgi:hypothetical protein
MEPFRLEGRIRYNPKIPKRAPRAMPDERWRDLFAAMRSNRDRRSSRWRSVLRRGPASCSAYAVATSTGAIS